jgi:hypothetical protein
MPETRLLDNQSTTCVTLKNMDEVIGKNLRSLQYRQRQGVTVTALMEDKRAEYLVEELFTENLDRNATGNDMRKLAINIDKRFDTVDKRFDAVDRRFDAVDRRFDAVDRASNQLRHEMNEGFNRIEYRLTHHLINNVGWMIATNIAVFGTVIASLAFLSTHLK